jgi:F0F1-type ATP synthase assembly protein I
MQLSWVVALATLIPLGAGILLDRLLRTAPLFVLMGGIIGILAGTVGAVRITTQAIESLSPPKDEKDLAARDREDQA